MEADRKYVGVCKKDVLHPIAVVDVNVDIRNAVPTILEPPACNGWIVVGAEARGAIAVRVMQATRRAERVQRGAPVHRLGSDQGCAHHQRRAFVQLVRDWVVGGSEPGRFDELDGHPSTLRWIAQLANQVHVLRRVGQL